MFSWGDREAMWLNAIEYGIYAVIKIQLRADTLSELNA